MAEYKVKITPYAKGQMQEIRDYIKYQLKNSEAAKNLLIEMRQRINELEYGSCYSSYICKKKST